MAKGANVEAGGGVVVAVSVINASSVDFSVSTVSLNAGNWNGTPPVPGAPLNGGGVVSYANSTASTFGSAAANLVFTSAGGGEVDMAWLWSPNSSFYATGTVVGTGIVSMTYTVTGVSTVRPMVTYTITDASAARRNR